MAIRLSAYLWLRNNDLMPLAEEPYREPALSSEDKAALKALLVKIDNFHSGSHFKKIHEIEAGHPNVAVPVTAEYIEISPNPEVTAMMFEGIHQILQKYRLNPDVYRRLGLAFEEIGAEPMPDTAAAIEYMKLEYERAQMNHGYCTETRCWNAVRECKQKERER